MISENIACCTKHVAVSIFIRGFPSELSPLLESIVFTGSACFFSQLKLKHARELHMDDFHWLDRNDGCLIILFEVSVKFSEVQDWI